MNRTVDEKFPILANKQRTPEGGYRIVLSAAHREHGYSHAFFRTYQRATRAHDGLGTATATAGVTAVSTCGENSCGVLAERGGFEPPVQLLTVQRFSKPPPSATRPPLRDGLAPSLYQWEGISGRSRSFWQSALVFLSRSARGVLAGMTVAQRIGHRLHNLIPDNVFAGTGLVCRLGILFVQAKGGRVQPEDGMH